VFLGLVESAPEHIRPILVDDIIDYCKRYRKDQFGTSQDEGDDKEDGEQS
jgi:hypothetical protein